MVVIPKIRGDATWLRPETIIQSIQDGDMSPSFAANVAQSGRR
jgi:hypothetical protein